MRIPGFARVVSENCTQYKLNNKKVVIDGQNFLYRSYTNSELPYTFGCECDKYAKYLKDYLSDFKKCDVTCYVIFKGGHENFEKVVNKVVESNETQETHDFVARPIFMKDVYIQVLDELDIKYVICEFEAKKDCIALAKKLDCPVISFDIEILFSGVFYVPYDSVKYDKTLNEVNCRIINLDMFIGNFSLTKDKVAIFIALTDEQILPKDSFSTFFKQIGILNYGYQRNKTLLNYIKRFKEDSIMNSILKSKINKTDLNEAIQKANARIMIDINDYNGFPIQYLVDRNSISVKINDTDWFQKGIVLKYIALQYSNLYRSNSVLGSWVLFDVVDPLYFSVEIIKYAFDLLTGFQNEGFDFYHNRKNKVERIKESIDMEHNGCVFINGWNDVRSLKLFEYFINATIGIDLENVNDIPEDAQLLLISLVYFAKKQKINVLNIVKCVLLSYVMLGIVFQKLNKYDTPGTCTWTNVLKEDCEVADDMLFEYFNIKQFEFDLIYHLELYHPLVEFQHCLQHLNFLNTLCGSPYTPTVYRKTFNGTFVYKVLYSCEDDFTQFANRTLRSAPTVHNVLDVLVNKFNELT